MSVPVRLTRLVGGCELGIVGLIKLLRVIDIV